MTATVRPAQIVRSLWDFTPDQVQPVSQGGSQAWEISKGEDRYFLKRHRFVDDPASLEWELRLLHQLDAQDAPLQVPSPWPLPDGQLHGIWDNKPWCLFRALDGRPAAMAQWDGDLAGKLGRRMAQFHNATQAMDLAQRPGQNSILTDGHPRPPGASLQELVDLARRTRPADKDQAILLDNLGNIVGDLQLLRHQLRQSLGGRRPQLVHGDFMPWNVLLDKEGEIAALLDFEFALLDHPIADLGRVAYIPSKHVGEDGPYPSAWILALTAGYTSTAPLQPAELEALPDFMRLYFLVGCLGMMGQWLFDGPQWPHLKNHPALYAGLWPNYLDLCRGADSLKSRLLALA